MKKQRTRSLAKWVLGALGVTVAATVWIIHGALSIPAAVLPSAENFSLAGVTLIQPGGSRTESGTIAVSGDRIQRGAHGSAENPRVLDEYSGMFILPGLIDMHVHLPPANALKLTNQSCCFI